MANNAPLAEKIRPKNLDEIIGQSHLFGKNGPLTAIKKNKNIPSIILWGPPGVGKTSIAKALATIGEYEFIYMSAINSGVADIKKIVENIDKDSLLHKKTVLMVDEIHHFNKNQQDLFLPFIEDGTIILIGTTTQNPSFALNSALLSRCKIITLEPLNDDELEEVLKRVEKFTKKKLLLDKEARNYLINIAHGDCRYLLNACEEILEIKEKLKIADLQNLISQRAAHFDNKGDVHFNLISAFHKSLRGSDVNAALYYLARMLEAKEDPLYILRRLARFATEDIGTADPNALLQVMAALENYRFLGNGEGDYALSHATIYCATAPKSNASYMAHKEAIKEARNSTHIMPPKNILNAPTKAMKDLDYHEGYIYDHDVENAFSGQEFFPEEILKNGRPNFYQPNERGFERDLKKRMEYWSQLKEKLNKS